VLWGIELGRYRGERMKWKKEKMNVGVIEDGGEDKGV
jgi:hypothetical protein